MRPAVDLSSAGEDDAEAGIVGAARLQQRQLGTAIDLEIGLGIVHRVDVARLAGQVEENVLAPQPPDQLIDVADVEHIDLDLTLDPLEVGRRPSVGGYERVEEGQPATSRD